MSFTITQNLFTNDSTTLSVVRCNDDAVSARHLQPLLDTALAERALGISAAFAPSCRITMLAFSTHSRALVVKISDSSTSDRLKQRHITRSRKLIQEHLLLRPGFRKYTFMMDKLSVALYMDLSIRINDAVDMLSVAPTDSRHSMQALMNSMGGETMLDKKNVQSLFFDTFGSSTVDTTSKVALKAWAAYRAATLQHMSSRFSSLPTIDTMAFPKAHLMALANISRNTDRLEALKPIAVKNDVNKEFTVKKGAINLLCDRFPTRIKQSKNQVVRIEVQGKTATNEVIGRAGRVSGCSARICVNERVEGTKVVSVTTIGKEDPTLAESTRQDVILSVLQRRTNTLSNPFFKTMWLPGEPPSWVELKGPRRSVPVYFSCELNSSQHAAVRRILSDKPDDRIVIIHGPPGTGKTTVIAAAVMSYDHANSDQTLWIAAQSNVAVKNIAEKFIKEGFRKFKLLVSKDFHYEWHEHLYEQLEPRLIRSDRFKMSIVEASRKLLDCKVILCTLSMFSNPRIDVFLRIVQVEMIILDEASQIECGDYLPIFHRFHTTLSKVVFIGDDQQLPPYGQEDIKELRSVFEFSHLRKRALFLDTQYRMPHAIGTFISRNVYGNKLRTEHECTTPKVCRFVNVSNGQEMKMGHSWTNPEEARVVVKLAEIYQSQSMRFRIITPYDAQRSLIEKNLKSAKLDWEDKVFNVDSFQGNEDDHIIVSVVRSKGPGFLKNQRRTNVMLTRCKKSMIICSSRAFLFGGASKTLVGKLAAVVDRENWINGKDVLRVDGRTITTFA